jgi:hypothetical protein
MRNGCAGLVYQWAVGGRAVEQRGWDLMLARVTRRSSLGGDIDHHIDEHHHPILDLKVYLQGSDSRSHQPRTAGLR